MTTNSLWDSFISLINSYYGSKFASNKREVSKHIQNGSDMINCYLSRFGDVIKIESSTINISTSSAEYAFQLFVNSN